MYPHKISNNEIIQQTSDVYRRFQDAESDEKSLGSGTDGDADEFQTLITKPEKKISQEDGAGASKGRKVKYCFIGFAIVSIVSLLSTINLPLTNVRGRTGSIPGWSLNTSRHTIDYVLPAENTTSIEPANTCTEERSSEKIFLLIVVCSSARNFEARQTIRETWGNVSEFNYPVFDQFHSKMKGKYLEMNSKLWKEYVTAGIETNSTSNSSQKDVLNQNINVKVLFLLGQTGFRYKPQNQLTKTPGFEEEDIDEIQLRINNESEVFGDVIQENFIDSYNNLTLKSIMMLKWVTNNCNGKVKYIMKCDDDTFINVPNLIQVLLGGTVPLYNASIPFYDRNTIIVKAKKNRLVDVKRMLLGFLFCDVKPIADTSSKWYSPNYMYGGDFYPNYLSGTAYLMSLDAAKLLYKVSLTTPIFHLEDVYITGIVASRVNLKRYHHPLFFYSYTKDYCALRGMISQHQLQPSDIKNAYDFIRNTSIVCKAPEKNFSMAKMKLQQRKKCQ